MIKAVVFDIDGVLIDSFEANLTFFQRLFESTGHRVPTREEYRPFFHGTMINLIREFVGDNEDEVLRVLKIARERGVPYPREMLRSPPNSKETIDELSKTYKLGIVTSRIKESVLDSDQIQDIKEYFPVIVCYDDTTKHKPDPEPLLLAAKKLGVEPKEIVYIGDVDNDIIAARAAGTKCIHFTPAEQTNADARTYEFSEIPKIVSEL